MSEQPTAEHILSRLAVWATPQVREALTAATRSLDNTFAAADGRLGALDREWGFITPGGLGPPKTGPLDPYRDALERAHDFFVPAEMVHRAFGGAGLQEIAAPDVAGPLQGWQLPGNTALQAFLTQTPREAAALPAYAFSSYRDAASAFILLATLAHLFGNSGTHPTPLPAWIEVPLRQVADRLEVPATLTGHFLTVENWTTGRHDADLRGPAIHSIRLMHPAFGHDQERVYHGIPACMAYAMRHVPAHIADIVKGLERAAEATSGHSNISTTLTDITERVHAITDALINAKLELQRISSDPRSSTHVSPAVFIRHMQPLHKGILVRDDKGVPRLSDGVSGLHFSLFYMIDLFIGRYQQGARGSLAQMRSVVNSFPAPQRAFAAALDQLPRDATLSGIVSILPTATPLTRAFNRLIEAYAGDGGILAAHARKLMNFMHNGVQVDTAAQGHLGEAARPSLGLNHAAAQKAFAIMAEAIAERAVLRKSPSMARVAKTVHSANLSANLGTVSFGLSGTGIRYHWGDVVKVLLPRPAGDAEDWFLALGGDGPLIDLSSLPAEDTFGWGWQDLFQALGWDPRGVDRRTLCPWIWSAEVPYGERGQHVRLRSPREINNRHSFELGSRSRPPLKLGTDILAHSRPVSPRIYSACGHAEDELLVVISRPADHRHHHGFDRMTDVGLGEAWIDVSPGTHFAPPPAEANLVLVASGSGIAPFVGLAATLGDEIESVTVVHQCRSNDLFLANVGAWLDLTGRHANSVVLGYVSGERGTRTPSLGYRIQGGEVRDLWIVDRTSPHGFYFMCPRFSERLEQVTRPDGRNLVYCCGGERSAVTPVQRAVERLGARYEFVVETQGLSHNRGVASKYVMLADALVDLEGVKPTHPGGADVLDRILEAGAASDPPSATETDVDNGAKAVSDVTELFRALHPCPYNLIRCLGSQFDLEYEAFLEFIESEAGRGADMGALAHHYAIAALDHPDRLDLIRAAVAAELRAIRNLDGDDATRDASTRERQQVDDLQRVLLHLPHGDDLHRTAEAVLAHLAQHERAG